VIAKEAGDEEILKTGTVDFFSFSYYSKTSTPLVLFIKLNYISAYHCIISSQTTINKKAIEQRACNHAYPIALNPRLGLAGKDLHFLVFYILA